MRKSGRFLLSIHNEAREADEFDDVIVATESQLVADECGKLNIHVMLAEKFKYPVDAVNMTTIKLAINDDGRLIFMSRAAIPYPKEALGYPCTRT